MHARPAPVTSHAQHKCEYAEHQPRGRARPRHWDLHRAGAATLNRRSARAQIATKALEVAAKIGRAAITELAILLQRFVDDFLEANGNLRIEAREWRRRAVQNAIRHDSR